MTILAPKADAILREFPGPVTLRPRRWKGLVVALACLPFAALGAWGIRPESPPHILLIGIFLLVCFGVGGPAAAVALFKGSTDLTLTADGMEFPNTLRGPVRWRWEQVSGFAPIHVAHAWRVVYDDETKQGSWGGKQRLLPNTYRMGATNMAALLTAWRERALAARKPTADGAYGSSSVSQ